VLCFAANRGSEGGMGWREINMNRRKPQTQFAAIAVAPGEDRRTAVLRKAAAQALDALREQLPALEEESQSKLAPFLAGYLLGYARQIASKHDLTGDEIGNELMAAFERHEASPGGIRISVIPVSGIASDERPDAGRLVGRLEALCDTRHLVRALLRCLANANAAENFITACDTAAGPMQSRAPTMNLRFTRTERAIVTAGLERAGGVAPGPSTESKSQW
jgi:hypothetical protein